MKKNINPEYVSPAVDCLELGTSNVFAASVQNITADDWQEGNSNWWEE